MRAAVDGTSEDGPRPGPGTAGDDAATDSGPAVIGPAPVRHSGDRIADRYRLEECLSQAGVFTSWRAVDEKLRRAVGIHLMASGNTRSERVLAAARSAALLGDLRFVQVLDAVDDGELVYVVREWLPDATDLGALLAAGPLEPHDAYQLVRQTSEAMAAAQRRGQSHLRLVPSAVLRTDSGQYRITGLAVDAALHGLEAESRAAADLADTRALGALLYAALVQRWPAEGVHHGLPGLPKGAGGAVAPEQIRAGVHRGLSELAARALFEEPGRHLTPITSTAELAQAVAELPKVRAPEPPPITPLSPAGPGYGRAGFSAAPAAAMAAGSGGPAVAGAAASPVPAAAAPRPPALPGRAGRAVTWAVGAMLVAAIGLGSWGLAEAMLHHGDQAKAAVQSDTGAGLGGSGAAASPGKPIGITAAHEFSPLAAPISPDQVPNAVDGKNGTSWITSHYDGYPNFGNLAPRAQGGGIWVDLGSVHTVTEVKVALPVSGETVDLRAAPESAGDPSSLGLSGWSTQLSASRTAGATVDVRLAQPVRTRYVLVHISALPPMPGSSDSYRGGISEITVYGRG